MNLKFFKRNKRQDTFGDYLTQSNAQELRVWRANLEQIKTEYEEEIVAKAKAVCHIRDSINQINKLLKAGEENERAYNHKADERVSIQDENRKRNDIIFLPFGHYISLN